MVFLEVENADVIYIKEDDCIVTDKEALGL